MTEHMNNLKGNQERLTLISKMSFEWHPIRMSPKNMKIGERSIPPGINNQ